LNNNYNDNIRTRNEPGIMNESNIKSAIELKRVTNTSESKTRPIRNQAIGIRTEETPREKGLEIVTDYNQIALHAQHAEEEQNQNIQVEEIPVVEIDVKELESYAVAPF
jgi:hypothetical protein